MRSAEIRDRVLLRLQPRSFQCRSLLVVSDLRGHVLESLSFSFVRIIPGRADGCGRSRYGCHLLLCFPGIVESSVLFGVS